MYSLQGIEIRGHVWREDEEPIDIEDFWDKFITFVEDNYWKFSGSTSVENLVDE